MTTIIITRFFPSLLGSPIGHPQLWVSKRFLYKSPENKSFWLRGPYYLLQLLNSAIIA